MTVDARLKRTSAGDEILVAQGHYQRESPGLVIDKRVELLRAYESRTWTRGAGSHRTLLEEVSDTDANDDRSSSAIPRATVSFVGARLGADTELDGFTILGNSRGAAYVAAVSVSSAGPTLNYNTIPAGKPAGVSPGNADGSARRAVYGTDTGARLIGNIIDGGTSRADRL